MGFKEDIALLRDLLFVCMRLNRQSKTGDKQAQERIDEIHNGKHGDQQGCFVQWDDAIERLEKNYAAETYLSSDKNPWDSLERVARGVAAYFLEMVMTREKAIKLMLIAYKTHLESMVHPAIWNPGLARKLDAVITLLDVINEEESRET